MAMMKFETSTAGGEVSGGGIGGAAAIAAVPATWAKRASSGGNGLALGGPDLPTSAKNKKESLDCDALQPAESLAFLSKVKLKMQTCFVTTLWVQ